MKRCDLPQHYLTVEHQRIALLLLSKLFRADHEQRSSSSTNDACRTMNSSSPTLPAAIYMAIDQDRLEDRSGSNEESVNIMSASVTVFADEPRKLAEAALEQSQIVQSTSEHVSKLMISMEESNASASACKVNLQILREQLHSLQSIHRGRLLTSYDGTLVWKVTQVEASRSLTTVNDYSRP
jgi:hypothetical protein